MPKVPRLTPSTSMLLDDADLIGIPFLQLTLHSSELVAVGLVHGIFHKDTLSKLKFHQHNSCVLSQDYFSVNLKSRLREFLSQRADIFQQVNK